MAHLSAGLSLKISHRRAAAAFFLLVRLESSACFVTERDGVFTVGKPLRMYATHIIYQTDVLPLILELLVKF